MKYKVGDIVKLRDDLEHNKFYGGTGYDKGMDIMRNEPVEINCVFGKNYRVFDKCNERWLLTDEMIEGLWEECKSTEQVSKSESKLRLIDILNKIANGELKEGSKVKLLSLDNEYILSEYRGLVDEYGKDVFETYNFYVLNTEVELIEPNDFGGADKMAETNQFREDTKMIETTDNTKIEELDIRDTYLQEGILKLADKLNEVIRYINKENNNE